MAIMAIDIGGTAIKAGVISTSGHVLHKTHTHTPSSDYETMFVVLKELVYWGMDKEKIEGIALSMPCATDALTGKALSEGAMVYIKDQNPAKDLGAYFDLPFSAENDGNCAALAEVWIGGAKDVNDMALVVCGTGIGGAVVIDKHVQAGSRKFAGEFGMFIMGTSPEGRPQAWSEIGSTIGLVRSYAMASKIPLSDLNGKVVFDHALAGSQVAQNCIDGFFSIFAKGLHNIQHVYDPQVILIGGAISERPGFIEAIEGQLDELYQHFDYLMRRPTIAVCTCGADANLIGAVYHYLQRL